MTERRGAPRPIISVSKPRITSTASRSLSVVTYLSVALLILANRSKCATTPGVPGRDEGSSSGDIHDRVDTHDGVIFSPHLAAAGEGRAILLDCDEQALPMMLNLMLNLNKFYDIADVVDMTHVVCLDEKSCRTVSEIGLRIATEGVVNAIHRGFKAMGKKVEPEKPGPGNVLYTGNWLDDVMLAREYALIDLLKQNKMVLRTDADTCFREDPFTLLSSADSDIVVTVQPLDPNHENGYWAFDWSCPGSKHSKLNLTLNNGVIVLDGRKTVVRDTYGSAVGASMKLLYRQANGWAQRGFNAALYEDKLCLHPVERGKEMVRGQTSRGLTLASLQVCAPCEKCSDASKSDVAHANCLAGAEEKTAWLRHVSCWDMPLDWKEVERNGDAVDYLRRLQSRAKSNVQVQEKERGFTSTRVVDFMGHGGIHRRAKHEQRGS